MLQLTRNMTETGIIYDSENKESILPWEWYWRDEERDLNFSIDTVNKWKDTANAKALMNHKAESKEIEQEIKEKENDKKQAVKEVKSEYVETLFKQE